MTRVASVERLLGRAVAANNRRLRLRALDAGASNPRPLVDVGWTTDLAARWASIREEWDLAVAAGVRFPLLEDLLTEPQGTEGPWRAATLIAGGRRVARVADRFPATVAAVERVPGLRAALFSILEPGTELTPHEGPNAGVLRYHLGIDCPAEGAALRVGDVEVPYRDGEAVLFDDTVRHAAWNRSDRRRVTLFLEVERPATGLVSAGNRVVQALIGLDPRYRGTMTRAAEWDVALNGTAS